MTTEEFHHRDRCAIAGIGSTEFSRHSGRSVLTLATEASLEAITDAGLAPADIDGIVSCEHDSVRPTALAESVGVHNLTWSGSAGPGGVAPSSQVAQAVGAVVSGQARAVLIFRALNGRSGARFGAALADAAASRTGGQGTYDEFFHPFGLLTAGQFYALMARRHMIEYGTTADHLGAIAVTCRARANTNPAAMMNGKSLSLEAYRAAPMVSDPLRLYDYTPETDGACAVVIVGAQRARDLRRPPVLIRAVSFGSGPEPQPGMLFPALTRADLTTTPSTHTAALLYERAGLGPGDIDVAQLYDCFTITALVQLEDYGFCAKGEGGPFAASGALDLDGAIPINTAGGHLSEGYIHGMNHVLEGVRQIRGTSTAQVPGANVCLVTSSPPPATGAMILVAA